VRKLLCYINYIFYGPNKHTIHSVDTRSFYAVFKLTFSNQYKI